MNNLSRKEQYLHGPAIPLLNSGNWNPDLHPRDSNGEFIYTDGGLHGRSPSATPSRGRGRLTIYHGRPPNSQTYVAPNGQTFLAPAGTNFQAIYNAGLKNGFYNYSAGQKAIGQYGAYDFQRNGGGGNGSPRQQNTIYKQYENASNYAVGLYMTGAGYSPNKIAAFGTVFAYTMSSNAGSAAQSQWWSNGVAAASSGTGWQSNGNTYYFPAVRGRL